MRSGREQKMGAGRVALNRRERFESLVVREGLRSDCCSETWARRRLTDLAPIALSRVSPRPCKASRTPGIILIEPLFAKCAYVMAAEAEISRC